VIRAFSDVTRGEVLLPLTVPVRRADLVRYAGASGDFNPIHWNERFARSVGLPDVIAHGMLTMALGGRLLTSWAGDPGAVAEYTVRFAHPVVVPDGGAGALVEVSGVVRELREDEGAVRVELTVRCDDRKVLSRATAILRLRRS
jgi:acyl dehydratase